MCGRRRASRRAAAGGGAGTFYHWYSALQPIRGARPMLGVVLALHAALSTPRRALLHGAVTCMGMACQHVPGVALAATLPPGFEAARVEGIGGGADILSERPTVPDMVYPPLMNGSWTCRRIVNSIEGDLLQAEGAWRLLGGSGDFRQPESYIMRFLDVRTIGSTQYVTGLDGQRYYGVVLDRGRELNSRMRGATVTWGATEPNALSYQRNEGGRRGAADLAVIQRSIEVDGAASMGQGWGSNELVRITTRASPLGDGALGLGAFEVNYATRVQRRWRRSTTDLGEPCIEGLEIMKTYRVLDGVAGVEIPTSTTKSILRLTRLREQLRG